MKGNVCTTQNRMFIGILFFDLNIMHRKNKSFFFLFALFKKEKKFDKMIIGDSMERIIMHIDVNNAFLSWSAIDLLNQGYKYDIRDSYAIIGGDESKRSGIVLAKSNSAKKLGIKTADTIYSARKKCPNLNIYPPNYKFYSEMSYRLFDLLSKYTPDIEIASIDECYLDYGKVKKLYGDEIEFAYHLKKEIKDTLGFTVNIGIANNKLCAKMASDFLKPYKVHTLFEHEVKEKMYPLKVGELFGIGRRTVPKLEQLGIYTIADLANARKDMLQKYFKNMAEVMIEHAKGIDYSPVVSDEYDPKGIGNEITLVKDTISQKELYDDISLLVDNVAQRLRRRGKYAYTICVVLKDKDFKRKTHQKKLVNATNVTNVIEKTAYQVFDEMWDQRPIRLIGVRLDQLVEQSTKQMSLFEDIEGLEEEKKLDETLDSLKTKYGKSIIKKANLIDKEMKKKLEK